MSKPVINRGEVIRGYRTTLGLSQSKFGRLIGFEGGTVGQWERGESLSEAAFEALVQRAGMDPVSLLGEPGKVDLAAAGLAA